MVGLQVAAIVLVVGLGVFHPTRVSASVYLQYALALPLTAWALTSVNRPSLTDDLIVGAGLLLVLLDPIALGHRVAPLVRDPVVVRALMFLGWVVLSTGWSSNPDAPDSVTKLLRQLLPGVALLFLSPRSSGRGVVFFGGALAVVGVLFSEPFGDDRSTVAGLNPIPVAQAYAVAALASLGVPGVSPRARYAVVTTLGVLCVLTGQRGPAVGLLVGLLVHGIQRNPQASRRIHPAVRALGALMVIAAVLTVAGTASDRFEGLDPGEIAAGESVTTRFDQWGTAVDVGFSSPFVGVGLGDYSRIAHRNYPHNLPLEIFAEMGVVGLVLWVRFVVAALAAANRAGWLLAPLASALAFTLFSGDLTSNRLYLVLACGAATSARRPTRSDEAAGSEPVGDEADSHAG